MASDHARTSKRPWPAAIADTGLDWALVRRCAVVALIPLAFWAYDRLLYDYAPDRAAGLDYEVRTNRLTGAHCLKFREPPPPRLKDLAC